MLRGFSVLGLLLATGVKAGAPCPPGKMLDVVGDIGDNGSCDCNSFCASDWSNSLKTQRPNWKGSVCHNASVVRYGVDGTIKETAVACDATSKSSIRCNCVQAAFWCIPHDAKLGCTMACALPGLPSPVDNCVPVPLPTPPPTPPPTLPPTTPPPTPKGTVTISNLSPRLSTTGEIVNAHDGTVRFIDGAWWMHAAEYGECADPPMRGCDQSGPTRNTSCGFKPDHNVSIWKSKDLSSGSWEFIGRAVQCADLPDCGILYRPHMVYNPNTKLYVLYWNYVNKQGVYAGDGAATAKSPAGPFELQTQLVNTSYPTGDFDVFVDKDGSGYIIYGCVCDQPLTPPPPPDLCPVVLILRFSTHSFVFVHPSPPPTTYHLPPATSTSTSLRS
jgi:hypothetical protein